MGMLPHQCNIHYTNASGNLIGRKSSSASTALIDGSRLDELQQVGVDDVRMGLTHAVRQAGVRFQQSLGRQFGRQLAGNRERHDLIIQSVQHQQRHVDWLEVFREVRLGKRRHRVIVGFDGALDAGEPEFVDDTLRRCDSFAVVSVKRDGRVTIGLANSRKINWTRDDLLTFFWAFNTRQKSNK